jgi:type I restriction enzyme S subunit
MVANKTKNALVPKLRFKGFGDEWKPTLLGSTCRVTTGNKDTQNRVDDGAFPFFVRSNTVERINSYSFDGEAILTSGDGVGVGKNFHYINGKFDFHQRVYALLDFKKNYYGKFIYQLFVEKFYKRVMRLSAKNSVDSVRLNMITEMNVCFPTLPEQQKIAVFLSAVDEKIQLLTRKKELLEQYKKGVMQQLFAGKLRFKDSNGKAYPNWEEKRLDEVVSKFIVPMRDKPKDLSGPIPWCRIEDFDGKYLSKSKSNQGVNLETIKGMNLKVYPVGTLLVSCSANLGFCAITKAELITNQTFIGLVTDIKKIDVLYLLYVMRRSSIKLNILSSGTTISYLSREQFEKFKIPYPCLSEQNKLALCISNLDDKIDSVAHEITQTQTFKKGLLQQMFV